LKTYNNQDGEFKAIDQYPGQLGEAGALFKWLKFKFIPGGKLAQRPMMYIDGDESFTKTGVEKVIGAEESMKRENDQDFYRKFEAINRFALNNDLLRYGKAQIHVEDKDNGFISWFIKGEDTGEILFIVANEIPPTELYRDNKEDGTVEVINKTGNPIHDVDMHISEDFKVISEYILKDDSVDFEEIFEIPNYSDHHLRYSKLEPSEFHIYKISL
jgi:hypothetical protein